MCSLNTFLQKIFTEIPKVSLNKRCCFLFNLQKPIKYKLNNFSADKWWQNFSLIEILIDKGEYIN